LQAAEALRDADVMTLGWATYFRTLTAGASGSETTRRLAVSDSKVSYWRRGERQPTVREAVRIAREYERSPLEALVAAGYMDETDLPESVTIQPLSLGSFTDIELAEEMLRRARSGKSA